MKTVFIVILMFSFSLESLGGGIHIPGVIKWDPEKDVSKAGKKLNREFINAGKDINRVAIRFGNDANKFGVKFNRGIINISDSAHQAFVGIAILSTPGLEGVQYDYNSIWRYVARSLACAATICLSEVRLQEIREKEAAKTRNKLQAIISELKVIAKNNKINSMKEKINELGNLKRGTAKSLKSFNYSLGLSKGLSIVLNSEIEKRKILKSMNGQIQTRMAGGISLLAIAQDLKHTDINESSIILIMEALAKSANEIKKDVMEVTSVFVSSLDSEQLQKLVLGVEANIGCLLAEVDDLNELNLDLETEFSFWQTQLQQMEIK